MHGVQPKAKAKPITKAPIGVLPPFNSCNRVSEYKRLDFQNAGQVQAKQNNDDSGHDGERVFVLCGDLADLGRDCAQGDKHYAEAEDEANGIRHHAAHQPPLRGLQLIHSRAGDQGNVARDQRQDAGREKRNQPGEKSGDR